MPGKKLHKPNLLLVGNGFDIHHGLKSKYVDFIGMSLTTKETIYGNDYDFSAHFDYLTSINRELKWIDVEAEIEYLHNSINRFADESFSITSQGDVDYLINQNIDEYFSHILNGMNILKLISCFLINKGVMLNLNPTLTKTEYSDFVVDIIEDFNNFIEELRRYIEYIDNQQIIKYSSPMKTYLADMQYLVDYNYTTTASRFYAKEDCKLFKPHGSVDKSIVLGIPYDKSARFFKKVSKEMQVIAKEHTIFSSDWSKISIPNNSVNSLGMFNDSFTMAVMGHSLGDTDWHTLLRFFARTGNNDIENIDVFYHDENSKVELIQNVISMVGLEAALKDFEDNRIRFISYGDLNQFV